MKTTWKWIIGILVTILVAAGLASGGYYARSYMMAYRASQTAGQSTNTVPGTGQNQVQPGQPGWQHPDVQGWEGRNNGKFNGRMGESRMFGRSNFRQGMNMPFGIGFMLLGGILRLVPLVIFGLLLYGVYLLGRRSGQRSAIPAEAVNQKVVETQETELPKNDTPVN